MKFKITETHGPYRKGMIHEPKDENLSVWRGRDWAVPYRGEEKQTATKEPAETTNIKHVGGGWYELPNGERVRGKAAAEAALENMG